MRECLNVVKEMRAKIHEHQKRLQRLQDYRSRLTKELSDMPKSEGTTSRLESLTVEIMDCETLINTLTLIRIQCCAELCALINRRITDNDRQLILIERYVFAKPFKEIADKLGYSEQHVYRLHKAALNILKT